MRGYFTALEGLVEVGEQCGNVTLWHSSPPWSSFFGPQMAITYQLDAISQGPKLITSSSLDLSVAEASPSLYNRQFGQKSGGEASRADCETERSEANREARSGNEGAYVPECDKNGELFL